MIFKVVREEAIFYWKPQEVRNVKSVEYLLRTARRNKQSQLKKELLWAVASQVKESELLKLKPFEAHTLPGVPYWLDMEM